MGGGAGAERRRAAEDLLLQVAFLIVEQGLKERAAITEASEHGPLANFSFGGDRLHRDLGESALPFGRGVTSARSPSGWWDSRWEVWTHPDGRLGQYHAIWAWLLDEDPLTRWPAVCAPCLVIAFEHDLLFPQGSGARRPRRCPAGVRRDTGRNPQRTLREARRGQPTRARLLRSVKPRPAVGDEVALPRSSG